ncbi:MAG: glycosyltransferase family 2 protein [Candidatus Omnitrophica bacterium]|nr:glycosyltransferase family 2 protein [Candidatus Omnitrophota bacterium]
MRTLISAYERIPDSVKARAEEIYVIDDASNDNTYYAGLGYKFAHRVSKLNVYRNPHNLGYGGNQKRGYRYAIKKGYDIVVMLHGDVQYAPEKIPELIRPIEEGKADMVQGSRFLGNPLKGGMPLWKFAGNRFLTTLMNKILAIHLSEYHSGFRAYSCAALKKVHFTRLTDDFHFDTEIMLQFLESGLRIAEVPIPTHYGPESHVVGFGTSVRYGLNIIKSLIEYKLHKSKAFSLSSRKYQLTTSRSRVRS